MVLNFPGYLNKKSETIKGTGNAIIPEGTKVTWKMNTVATQKVDWLSDNIKQTFAKTDNIFSLSSNLKAFSCKSSFELTYASINEVSRNTLFIRTNSFSILLH